MHSATSNKVEQISIEGCAIQFDEVGEESFFTLLDHNRQAVYLCPTSRLVDCKAITDEQAAKVQSPKEITNLKSNKGAALSLLKQPVES